MFSGLFVVICVLIINNCCGHAWKPIVGSSPTTIYTADPGTKGSHFLSLEETIATLPLDAFAEGYDKFADIGSDLTADGYVYKYENTAKEDTCAVKKYAFNHDGTVHYNNHIPELDQFTICYWMRFTNHSGDHVLLTYAGKDEKRAVQFWVANSRNSSFLSMAIKGQQLYRLNYPLRIHKWHHACTSWNGKTGEWQVWLKSERIGRGFHNSLVGHKIPSNGKLFSGGSSVTGDISQGLHFEMTLIQIYKVALSAGKAHRDHKHHHVHHFDHEGQEVSTTTKTPPKINRPLPMNIFLASGQIPTRVRYNLAQNTATSSNIPVPSRKINENIGTTTHGGHSVTINTSFNSGQFHTGSRLISQQLIGHRPLSTQITETKRFNAPNVPVHYIDETETHILFKRQANSTKKLDESNESKLNDTVNNTKDKVFKKRELLLLQDGTIVNTNVGIQDYQNIGLAEFGGQKFKDDLTIKSNIEDEIKEHDREPAEEEVKAVMALCRNCDIEPFLGAIVLAWKDVEAELDNALMGLSVESCGHF